METRLFVLMPFRPEFDDVYTMVQDACRDGALAGLVSCQRADEIESPGRITDQILGAIRGAHLIVADLTGNNPNVMYELGYAHALEKPTVLMNQSISDAPFDVAALRQIVYDRSRLARDCRPRVITAIAEVLASLVGSSPAEPTRAGGAALSVALETLTPSDELVAKLQNLHVRLQLSRTTSDKTQASNLAKDLLALADRIAIVGVTPDDVDLRNAVTVMGNCAVELEIAGLNQEADDVFKRTLSLCPTLAGVRLQYSDFLVDRGRLTDAVTELERGRDLDGSHRLLIMLETKIALAKGDHTIGDRLRAAFDSENSNSSIAENYLRYLIGAQAPLLQVEDVSNRWIAASSDRDTSTRALRYVADYAASDRLDDAKAEEIYLDLLRSVTGAERAAILHNLATLCARSNRDDEAERHWREAYALAASDLAIRNSFSQFLQTRRKGLEAALKVSQGEPLERTP